MTTCPDCKLNIHGGNKRKINMVWHHKRCPVFNAELESRVRSKLRKKGKTLTAKQLGRTA